jgi:hypothetical protein
MPARGKVKPSRENLEGVVVRPQEARKDVCGHYLSHKDWEALVNSIHNKVVDLDPASSGLADIKTKDQTLEFINTFFTTHLIPELELTKPLNDFEKQICSLCILGFLLVVHTFNNDLVLNSSLSFESKKENRLKFSLDFFNKKTNCYAYQVLLHTDFSTVKNNIIRVCIFKEQPDGKIFVITNPDPTSVFQITRTENVEFIKTAEEKEKHIIGEYKKIGIDKEEFSKSQMPIIALLGAARKEEKWDKKIIYKNIEMIVSEILIRYCNIGFITGGYKGSKGLRKNPKQLTETLHPVGVTRAGYDIPKKYLKYTGVTVCEAGSKDSHQNPNFKCIFGKNWGDDTPALEYISDIAIFNAPFGAWTDLELLNFAVNNKKCFIYFNSKDYINKFGIADWLKTYLADTYILNYNNERFEFPIYKTNELIKMTEDIISHLKDKNLILDSCGIPKGKKSSQKKSDVFYDTQLHKWKKQSYLSEGERPVTVADLQSPNNNLDMYGEPMASAVFPPSKSATRPPSTSATRSASYKGSFRSQSNGVFRFPSVPEEPEGKHTATTAGKKRNKSKKKNRSLKKSKPGKKRKGVVTQGKGSKKEKPAKKGKPVKKRKGSKKGPN